MDLGISGKTAMVTGGTRGIGRAIVETFLAEGAHVAFCARNGTEIAEAEEALAAQGKAVGTVLDVSDATSLSAWVEATAAEFGTDAKKGDSVSVMLREQLAL